MDTLALRQADQALDISGHPYEPLDEVAADRLERIIADAIAHRTRAERGLEL